MKKTVHADLMDIAHGITIEIQTMLKDNKFDMVREIIYQKLIKLNCENNLRDKPTNNNASGEGGKMADVCPECGKQIFGNTYTEETPLGDVVYHLECAEKSGRYTPELGYVVNYDYPLRHARGEAVHTMKEVEQIVKRAKKEGFVNIRIDPIVT